MGVFDLADRLVVPPPPRSGEQIVISGAIGRIVAIVAVVEL